MKAVIIGGGISGLATAIMLQKKAAEKKIELKIILVEAETNLGGKIGTENFDGFICERGPLGFPGTKPYASDFSADLELNNQLISSSNTSSSRRFIFTDNKLHELPISLKGFLNTKLISGLSKPAFITELAAKTCPDELDEAISQFVIRHYNYEIQTKIVDALVNGIFAGDSNELSLKSCFPEIHQLEKYGKGSLLRALIKKQREAVKAKKGQQKVVQRQNAYKRNLYSFKPGLAAIVHGCMDFFKGDIISSCQARAIVKLGVNYQVYLANKADTLEADAVILATPAYNSKVILGDLDRKFSETLQKIPYAPVMVLYLGFERKDVLHDMDGPGFLIPSSEKFLTLGVQWVSSVFSEHAPSNHISLRMMLGGHKRPNVIEYDDGLIIKKGIDELKKAMRITNEPKLVKLFRHERAIPQYMVGHQKLLSDLDALQNKYAGLFLVGNAYRGIGINDCINQANQASAKCIEFLVGRIQASDRRQSCVNQVSAVN